MRFTITIFWTSFSILFFCYIGYGMILFFINKIRKTARPGSADPITVEWPPVTLVIAAYNEINILAEKITNTLAIDYPREKLTILVVTDGSTDGSAQIFQNSGDVILLHHPERKGKLAAISRTIPLVKTELVFFSDANTMLNKECIKRMVVHYKDPKTGGVAGEKKIISNRQGSAIGEGEGMYWKYESFMKKLDSNFNTVVGAAGELFSIRTSLFDPPSLHLLLDDFVISMQVCLRGYKIKYEPGAFATEFPSASLKEEAKRKIRISAGAYQSIGYLKECLDFFKHPLLCFQYVSRRLLRWVFCPWMLILLLASNILIVARYDTSLFYSFFLAAQLVCYTMALLRWLLIQKIKNAGIMAIPFYFLFMNYCLVRGFIRFLGNKQPVLWERSVRQDKI